MTYMAVFRLAKVDPHPLGIAWCPGSAQAKEILQWSWRAIPEVEPETNCRRNAGQQ